MRRTSLALLLLPFAVALPAQAGLFDDTEARKQIAELKVQDETHSRALLDLASQLQALRDENAKLRGQLETLTYELDTAKKRQQDLYLDLDTRMRKFEPQTPSGDAATSGAAGDAATEGQEYEAALTLFKAGKYKEASAAFTTFVANRSASSLAPSAQYWLGNALHAQRDCKRALEVQSQLVAKWPSNPKAPEAMLVMATCQQEMGNPNAARRTLENLVAQYPEAPASDTARQRLKKR